MSCGRHSPLVSALLAVHITTHAALGHSGGGHRSAVSLVPSMKRQRRAGPVVVRFRRSTASTAQSEDGFEIARYCPLGWSVELCAPPGVLPTQSSSATLN